MTWKLKIVKFNGDDTEEHEIPLNGMTMEQSVDFTNDLASALGLVFRSDYSLFGGYYNSSNQSATNSFYMTLK